jgi:hypothetical protein
MSGGARQRGCKFFFSLWVVVWGRGDLRAVFANKQFLRPVARYVALLPSQSRSKNAVEGVEFRRGGGNHGKFSCPRGR